MVVLVDPMPSRSGLVQLVGRVQRKPFGVCVPRGTVLCMAFLNAQKYQKATPEVRHSLLRRDVGDPVANVVAALQAHDPELAELLINKTAENIKIRDISEPRPKQQTVSDEGPPSPTTWRCSDCPASSLTTRC